MLTPDIRGEQARAHREPPYIPAREEKVGADVLLPARRPVPDPGQHEEVGGDDGDVESVQVAHGDRKSTRLNSSHGYISYAVFCLKKKKNTTKLASVVMLTRYTALCNRLLINVQVLMLCAFIAAGNDNTHYWTSLTSKLDNMSMTT